MRAYARKLENTPNGSIVNNAVVYTDENSPRSMYCLHGRVEILIPFPHSSIDIVHISLVDGVIEKTDATNGDKVVGTLLASHIDEDGNIAETPAGGLHPCFWRGQR